MYNEHVGAIRYPFFVTRRIIKIKRIKRQGNPFLVAKKGRVLYNKSVKYYEVAVKICV